MLCEGFLFYMKICLECRTPRGVGTHLSAKRRFCDRSSDNVFLHLLDAAEFFLRLALDGGFL